MNTTGRFEIIIANIVTIVAGLILGIPLISTLALSITFLISAILAIDIVGYIKEKRLPRMLEGFGDLCNFIAVILMLAGVKYSNIIFLISSIGLIIVDGVLIFIQARKDGKTKEEALEAVKEEIKN